MKIFSKVLLNALSVGILLPTAVAPAPPRLATDKSAIIATLHAEGAQIYECKPDAARPEPRPLTWHFREPIATLLVGGQTVGRHYAGPSWELVDGGEVKGRVVKSTPAPAASDIPWLELEVVDRANKGILFDAVAIFRINTKGGVEQGSCESEGKYLSSPYTADYLFRRKND
jgi:hypothetical protein